jgi:hypothetical protein
MTIQKSEFLRLPVVSAGAEFLVMGYGTLIISPPFVIPKHEQHDEMMEWRGPFDPEAFDAKKATKEMRKVK